jgi:uncharacterized protein YndB with AHSA1/START domain
MDNKTIATTDTETKALVMKRTFDAPKDAVWRAYADKEWFVQWWGPEGFETSVKQFDFAPGGRNHYGMKGIDPQQTEWFGQTAWGIMAYETISEPDSLRYKDYFCDEAGTIDDSLPAMTIVVELTESDGKTTVTSTSYADSLEDIETLLAMGVVDGYSSSCDKLARLLSA